VNPEGILCVLGWEGREKPHDGSSSVGVKVP